MTLRISFIGTGAGGSIHRGHTAIALECPDGTRLLLDAASGNTVSRGLHELGMEVADYHHVLLSHTHADHMSGLPSVQLVHTRSLEGGLRLMSTRPQKSWSKPRSYAGSCLRA